MKVPVSFGFPLAKGTTVGRVKFLGSVQVTYHSSTWNRQAKNKLAGKTATAYGKNKPRDDLQMSKLPAKPGREGTPYTFQNTNSSLVIPAH